MEACPEKENKNDEYHLLKMSERTEDTYPGKEKTGGVGACWMGIL